MATFLWTQSSFFFLSLNTLTGHMSHTVVWQASITVNHPHVFCDCCCSLFSGLVMSDSLWPHELEHARLPCPSLSPRVCSDSCPLSQWYHPNISSSVTPFSFCPQSFPAPGSFPKSRLFASVAKGLKYFGITIWFDQAAAAWKECWSHALSEHLWWDGRRSTLHTLS